MFFLSLLDLAELLYKLTDDWENAETAWNIPDVFHLTFYDLEKELRKLNRSVQMEWRKEAVAEQVAPDDKKVRYRYGWFPKISILEELPELELAELGTPDQLTLEEAAPAQQETAP